jgi:hypothetical protein
MSLGEPQSTTAESQSATSILIIVIPLLVELSLELFLEIFLELIIEY